MINSIKISLTSAVAGIIIAFLECPCGTSASGQTESCFYDSSEYGIQLCRYSAGFRLYDSFGQCRTGGQYRQGIGHQCFIHIQSVHDERHEPDLYLFPDSAFHTSYPWPLTVCRNSGRRPVHCWEVHRESSGEKSVSRY